MESYWLTVERVFGERVGERVAIVLECEDGLRYGFLLSHGDVASLAFRGFDTRRQVARIEPEDVWSLMCAEIESVNHLRNAYEDIVVAKILVTADPRDPWVIWCWIPATIAGSLRSLLCVNA